MAPTIVQSHPAAQRLGWQLVAALVAAAVAILLLMGVSPTRGTGSPRPMPGVSLDREPNRAPAADPALEGWAEQPEYIRTGDEELESSLLVAQSLAEEAGRHAAVLQKCRAREYDCNGATEAWLTFGRLYVVHAATRRVAARVRLCREDGDVVPVEQDGNDVWVTAPEGASGVVVLTTAPDGGLPDTEPLPLGELVFFVE